MLKLKKIKDFLQLDKSINLNHIHYHYPNSSSTTLKNINLNIPARKTVGLVGAMVVVKLLQLILFLAYLKLSKEH